MMSGLIVGFGEVARYGHWPAFAGLSGARIVGVVDEQPARRELARDVIPGVAVFESIDAVTVPVQFADICTPPSRHAEAMTASLRRGWHVLCEKPFVLQSALIEPLRREAVARGLAVVPVDNWKYAPILARTTALLRGGAIGRLRQVDIVTTRTGAAATSGGGGYNWRSDPAVSGGGILMDHGWHAVYLALHWFAEPPTSVAADLRRTGLSQVETDADLRIAFPSGDATVRLTWNGDSRRNTVRLTGESGVITVDDGWLRVDGRVTLAEQLPPLTAGSHHPEWFAAMLPDVIDAFARPETSRNRLDEAAACLDVIERAYLASPVAVT